MPRRGRKRKKTRTHTTESETVGNSLETTTKIPKSLVVSLYSAGVRDAAMKNLVCSTLTNFLLVDSTGEM